MLQRKTSILRPPVLGAFLTGLLLVWFGAPYAVSALLRVPYGNEIARIDASAGSDGAGNRAGDSAEDAVSLRQRPRLGLLLQAITSYEAALRWHPDGRHWAELGHLYCAAAVPLQGQRRRAFLASCIRAHETALARDPAQPFAALQLAAAEHELRGTTRAFVQAFAQSFTMGEIIPQLAVQRTELGLRSWGALDGELREKVRAQVRMAMKLYPRRLSQIGAVSPARNRLIESTLADDPKALADYRWYLSQR